ncbi:MAG: RHS repeat-associated core domain-containing protein [Candidatus Diapherotrites archaeon]
MKYKKLIAFFAFLLIIQLAAAFTETNTTYFYANGQRIARIVNGSSVEYYHSDQLGSTSLMTNSSGASVMQESYDPYGNTLQVSGTSSTNYGFTGKELDPKSNLYYYGARYYDPLIGRFITADKVSGKLEKPQTLNRYSYVSNNPLKFVDPSGNAEVTSTYKDKQKEVSNYYKSAGVNFDSLKSDLLISFNEGQIPKVSYGGIKDSLQPLGATLSSIFLEVRFNSTNQKTLLNMKGYSIADIGRVVDLLNSDSTTSVTVLDTLIQSDITLLPSLTKTFNISPSSSMLDVAYYYASYYTIAHEYAHSSDFYKTGGSISKADIEILGHKAELAFINNFLAKKVLNDYKNNVLNREQYDFVNQLLDARRNDIKSQIKYWEQQKK